jgi:hypothetical protein
MYPVAWMLEMLVKPAPVTRDQLVMMRLGNVGNIDEMKSVFGVVPRSFEQGLNQYLR